MIRAISILFLLLSLSAHAAFETPLITHTKMTPRTILRTGFWGYIDVVGNLDKIVDNRVTVIGNFQYRIGEDNWRELGNNPAGNKIWMVSRGVNFRSIHFSDMTASSVDLRVCLEGQCSLPYIVYFVPKLIRVQSPEDGVITPFKRNLRVSLMHHQLGGVKFYIGELDPFPGSSEIFYSGKVEIDPAGTCPQVAPMDRLACEFRIPDEIMAKPGRYALTAVSSLGTSINHLEFTVTGPYKISKVFPERFESPLQDLITLQLSDAMTPNDSFEVVGVSHCPGMHMPIETVGRDKILVRLPPECMPQSGCGDLEMDVLTPIGPQRVKLPYQM